MEEPPLSNDSTQAGWLTPTVDNTDYDEALERNLSRWISAVSGLPGKMMFPRWQPQEKTRTLPDANANWCAYGVLSVTADYNPAFTNTTDTGTELWRHETLECLISFYGPAGQRSSLQFRDGITLNQNNDELTKLHLSLGDYGRIMAVPEFLSEQWIRRYDITVRLRRKIIREYGIKSIAEAPVQFFGE
ncbi:hypothetical protein NJH77_26060 [Serratia fonticola]|uniref:phage neck terminator protein n=1 Tax=Serratia fonticola TaxID=47917 RepID=UPI0020983A18|nr:hypothetical protein [Serratia fonticola]MCO7512711.1 hypothetical protein [Serratia fonticola]